MARRAIIDVDSKRPRRPVPDAVVRPQRQTRLFVALQTTLALLWGALIAAFGAAGVGLGALLAVPLGGLLLWSHFRTPAGGRNVEVGPEGLYCEGRLVADRADVERTLWVTEPSGVVVSIGLKQGFHVAVEVPSPEAAEDLVSAMGGGVTQRTAEFLTDGPVARAGLFPAIAWSLVLFSAAILLLARGTPLGFAVAGLWYAGVLLWLLPTRVHVGTDGARFTWLGRARTVRFADLARVERRKDTLTLVRHDGSEVPIAADWVKRLRSTSQPEYASRAAYLDAIAARIEQAWSAARGAASLDLRRQDQPISDWVRSLRGLVERGAAGFRAAPALPAALWRTVEDGHAAPATRAAAAVALGPTLDEVGRARLSAIAGVSVEPKLRIAIEAAAGLEEAAIAEALAALERDALTAKR